MYCTIMHVCRFCVCLSNYDKCLLFSYFLPDKQRQTKQKSPLATGVDEMQFDHLFSYTNVNSDDLQRRCLELTAWNQTKMGSNTFVGGVRLSLGAGKFIGRYEMNDILSNALFLDVIFFIIVGSLVDMRESVFFYKIFILSGYGLSLSPKAILYLYLMQMRYLLFV